MILAQKKAKFDPYNVFLAIATNIPQRLETGFVVQGHILSFYNIYIYCRSLISCKAALQRVCYLFIFFLNKLILGKISIVCLLRHCLFDNILSKNSNIVKCTVKNKSVK